MAETTQETRQEKPAAAAKTTKTSSVYDNLPRLSRHARRILTIVLEKSAERAGGELAAAVQRDPDKLANLEARQAQLAGSIVQGVDLFRRELDDIRINAQIRAGRKARGAK